MDGPDAAGKTTLAAELAGRLAGKRDVIRASIDGFHRPRAQRYRRGDLSPEGAYHDTFDYGAVRAVLLDPLGPGGSRRYRTAVFATAATRRPNSPRSWRRPKPYRADAAPEASADVIIDNTDPVRPRR